MFQARRASLRLRNSSGIVTVTCSSLCVSRMLGVGMFGSMKKAPIRTVLSSTKQFTAQQLLIGLRSKSKQPSISKKKAPEGGLCWGYPDGNQAVLKVIV